MYEDTVPEVQAAASCSTRTYARTSIACVVYILETLWSRVTTVSRILDISEFYSNYWLSQANSFFCFILSTVGWIWLFHWSFNELICVLFDKFCHAILTHCVTHSMNIYCSNWFSSGYRPAPDRPVPDPPSAPEPADRAIGPVTRSDHCKNLRLKVCDHWFLLTSTRWMRQTFIRLQKPTIVLKKWATDAAIQRNVSNISIIR